MLNLLTNAEAELFNLLPADVRISVADFAHHSYLRQAIDVTYHLSNITYYNSGALDILDTVEPVVSVPYAGVDPR